MNEFGEFLYTLRKEKNMTQAELAGILGVTNKAVSKWETGEAMPETGLLLPISRIFGVTVDELLAGRRAEETAPEGAKQEEQFNPAEHLFTRGRNDPPKTLNEKICGAACAFIMLIGTLVYIFVGVFSDQWDRHWLIIPLCAMACGVTGIIFDLCNGRKRALKRERGENPYTGCICGILMLSCTGAYLIASALTGLWHPLWVIIVGGALISGVVGAVGEITFKKK